MKGCFRAVIITCCAFAGLFFVLIIVAISTSRTHQPASQTSAQPRFSAGPANGTTQVAADQPPTERSRTAGATTAPTPDPIAEAAAMLDEIEERLRTNKESLGKYYSTPEQIKQTESDAVTVTLIEGTYSRAKTTKEKRIHQKALSLKQALWPLTRQIYASSMEQVFIKQGMDARVTAVGRDKKNLRISFALMSRPLVYKLQNEAQLDEHAKQFGFTKVILTDGFEGSFGHTWTLDVKP